MRPLGVFLANAVLGIPLLLGSLPLMAPAVALCPSYPLTAWLAPHLWSEPSFRWGVAPLVSGVLGWLLYRRLLARSVPGSGGRLVRNALWGIAFGVLHAWVMGSLETVVAALSGPALAAGDVLMLASALLFSPPMLLGYPRAARCGGLAALTVIAAGTCFGIANGMLARWSARDRPRGAGVIRLGERVPRLSPHTRWMLGIAGLAAGVLGVTWAGDHLRLVLYPMPVVVLAPHDMGSMPSFSPDGSKIVHVREPGDIYVMGSDGSNLVRLTASPVTRRPSYSPDGRTIIYVSDGSPIESDGGRLSVMDASGRGSRRLGEGNPDLRGVDYPVFSPDGTRIACTIHGGRRLYLMDADGSRGAMLAAGPGVAHLSFSPDGSMLLYETYFGSAGRPAGIRLMSLDGQTTVFLDPSGMSPGFSPDGRRIVFQRATLDGHTVIEVMHRDGSNRRAILTARSRGPDPHPRFSPDGSRVVFTAGPSHDQGLYVMNADGTGVRRLSPHYEGPLGRLAPVVLAGTGVALAVLAAVGLASRRGARRSRR